MAKKHDTVVKLDGCLLIQTRIFGLTLEKFSRASISVAVRASDVPFLIDEDLFFFFFTISYCIVERI